MVFEQPFQILKGDIQVVQWAISLVVGKNDG